MIGSQGVVIQPPQQMPNEVLGLLRLAADPDLARVLLAHQDTWEKVYKENEALLKQIQKVKDLDAAKERVAKSQAAADEVLRQNDIRVKSLLEDAEKRAEDIVARAQARTEGLDSREREINERIHALDVRAAAVAEHEAQAEKLLASVEKTRRAVQEERKAMADKRKRLEQVLGDN